MQVPTPVYCVMMDGRDLTSSLRPRLIMLSLRESRAGDADELNITLDDHDGAIAIPARGQVLDVSFGWRDTGMVNKGLFTIDEVEASGTPDTIRVRGRSASLSEGLGERQEKSWHRKTLRDIVHAIADRHQLTPKVAADLAEIFIDHIDQSHESDMSFLMRLAKRYDAVMAVKADNLLFMPIGGAASVSGQALPVLVLTRSSGDRHRFHVAERESYDGVRAYWYENGKRKRHSVVVGGENNRNMKVLPESYPSQREAEAAAQAEYNRVTRGQATMSLNLALGVPDLFPESPIALSGWNKPEIDGAAWLVKSADHQVSNSGYTTSCELELRDDPTTDRHRSHFRRGGK